MYIEPLNALAEVIPLLDACELNHCGIDSSAPPQFFGIRENEQLIAVLGFERFDRVGLLRSLAVAPEFRGHGFARALVTHAEAQAQSQGVETLYLLTNTAESFFYAAGYVLTSRNMAPAVIRQTSQFAGLCPSSSAFLSKHLTESPRPCMMHAWHNHERELLNWLTRQVADRDAAKDLLHDLFLKAVRQGDRFCCLENARAWLFDVARNAVADQSRRRREIVEVPVDLVAEEVELRPVDSLASCLPRVLGELSPEDREAITLCDLEGMSQADFAARIGLSLSAAKSRVQRARKRLKNQLTTACQVEHDASGHVCGFIPRPAQSEPVPVNQGCSTKPGYCGN